MNISKFVVKACTLSAFALSLNLFALDMQKDVVPELPENTEAVVGFTPISFLENGLVKKIANDEMLGQSLNMGAANLNGLDAKITETLAKANLKKDDIKDVLVLTYGESKTTLLIFTKASPKQFQMLFDEVLASQGENKPVITDEVIDGVKTIQAVTKSEEGEKFSYLFQYKPGILAIVEEKSAVTGFAKLPRITKDNKLTKMLPKTVKANTYLWFVAQKLPGNATPEEGMFANCKAMRGLVSGTDSDVSLMASIEYPSADSAKSEVEKINAGLAEQTMAFTMMAPKVAKEIGEAVNFSTKGEKLIAKITVRESLIMELKAFFKQMQEQAKQAGAQGGFGGGDEIENFDEIEDVE